MAISDYGLSADLLTENPYLDGDLDISNNTEENSRAALMNASAKGTAANHFLDPVPFINKMAQTYLEARSDEINMNRDNMDYTNDSNGGDYGSICETIAYSLDLNGDGYVGIDDAYLFQKIYAMIILEVSESNLFTGLFDPVLSVTDLQSGFPQRTGLQLSNYYYQCIYHLGDDLETLYNTYIFNDGPERSYANCETLEEAKQVFNNKIDYIERNFMQITTDLVVNLMQKIEEVGNGVYLTIEQTEEWISEYGINNGFLNLLMPQYKRRVEVEDLNENFWVIGQVLDAVVTALWHRNGIVDILKEVITNINSIDIKIQRIENQIGGGDIEKISSLYGDSAVKTDMYSQFDFSELGLRIYTSGGTRDIKNIFTAYKGQGRGISTVPTDTFGNYRNEVNKAINNRGTPFYDGDILRNNIANNYEYFWQVIDKVIDGTITQDFFVSTENSNQHYELRDDVQVILYDSDYYNYSFSDGVSYLEDSKTQIKYNLTKAFLIPRNDLFQGEMISFGLNGTGRTILEDNTYATKYYNLADIKNENSTVSEVAFDAYGRKIFIRNPICEYDAKNNYLSSVKAFIWRTVPYTYEVTSGGVTRDCYKSSSRAAGMNNIQYISKDIDTCYNSHLSDNWTVSMINGRDELEKDTYVRQVDRGMGNFAKEIFYETANRGGCLFCAGSGYSLNGLEVDPNYSILNGGFCASKAGNTSGNHITDYISSLTIDSNQDISYLLGLMTEARLHYNTETSQFDDVRNSEVGTCYPNISFAFFRRTSGQYMYKRVSLSQIVFNVENNDHSENHPATIYLYGIKTNNEGVGAASLVSIGTYSESNPNFTYNDEDKTVVVNVGGTTAYSGYLLSIEPPDTKTQVRFSGINLFGTAENSFNNDNDVI